MEWIATGIRRGRSGRKREGIAMIIRSTHSPTRSAEAELTHAREVLLAESKAVESVAARIDGSFLRAVDAIADATGVVLVTGMGKAGLIAQKVAATMASTGTRAHFLHPGEACHGDLGRLAEGDVLLAFSHSGETEELVSILPAAKRLGAILIGVTGHATSTLSRLADVVIAYGPIEEACPIKLAPSASCSAMLALGDALAFVLMRRYDFRPEDFGRYHPSGSLGKRLRPVEEVMRTGSQLRLAKSCLTVREVLVAAHRTGRRTGAICLVDDEGQLDGIFTDSDLARLVEANDFAVFSQPMRDVMTRSPITCPMGMLVGEAVEIFRARQVSEIPVVDALGQPAGIVDITDLLDLLPEVA
jgi:arabinose-5-phosphate isomerase